MKLNSKSRLGLTVLVLAAASLAGGCWDDDDEVIEPPITAVPASAGASIAAYVAFIRALAIGDETSEPLELNSFTAPVDETSETAPVI